jgi:hypothetical protein
MFLKSFNKKFSRPGGAACFFGRPTQRLSGSGSGFSCFAQGGQPFEVPGNAFELQFQPVARQPQVAHPPVAGGALPPAEDLFNLGADGAQEPVGPQGRSRQLLSAHGLAQDAVGDPVFSAPLAASSAPIGLVGHHHFLVAPHHGVKPAAVMHVGAGQRDGADKGVGLVHRRMGLVAVVGLPSLGGEASLAIAAGFIPLGRSPAGGLQQRRIHQGAGLEDQPLLLQLPVDQAQQLFVQAVLAQPLAKAHQGGFIRHRILQSQADESTPRKTVGHQLLALRVGEAIAVLQQAHLKEGQRRTGRAPGGRRIHRLEGRLHRLPVQDGVEPLQKIVGRRRGHQAVQKSHLRIGRRVHAFLTVNQIKCSSSFCRGLELSFTAPVASKIKLKQRWSGLGHRFSRLLKNG